MKNRIASISLDLDNQWSYMKIHGDEGWDKYPSYLSIFVPYILDLLDELELRITFFVVGKDASIEENIPWLRMITDRGHEIGNHSFHHESWLQKYSRQELEKEIDDAEKAIEKATGYKTRGFRGPGFSWSMELLEVLNDRDYIFDASTLPTYIGPIARKYYFWKSDLSKEEKKDRSELFGTFRDGLRPLRPYYHQLRDSKKLLEIPVTTIPIIKTPFHLSYLLYLSGISPLLMKSYIGIALFMCKITRTSPSFLLHPLDLIGGDKVTQLAFFPGMNIDSETKSRVFKYVIKKLKSKFRLVTMEEHARTAGS
ncbi:MAG: polysaccharide deacetylase family protein [Bacteroidales bacterium]|nr:polysaccharide deacetylase family protein [Bacteroidales bacterium]MCF8454710.1 polysaccharide deacetylase family protein [Bacteroidales bacterium]